MKKFLLILPIAAAASPALATGGLICRTAGLRSVEVAAVVSHTAVSSVVSVRLIDEGRNVPVAVAQSWLEPNEFRLDLTNRNSTRHELRLRVTRNGRNYDGTIWRAGQRHWIRCREG